MRSKTDEGALICNLLTDASYCPSREHIVIHFASISHLAEVNKAEHVLLHFLSCPICSKTISKKEAVILKRLQFRLHILPLFFERERRRFESVLKNCRTHAVLFKQHENRDRIGNDIDVLVFKNALPAIASEGIKQGYQKTERVRHKEIQLTDPVHRYKVDVHHIIAFPLYGGLDAQEYEMIRRYSSDLLAFAKTRKPYGFVKIPIERYVVSRILHYWYNDLLCGLYPLYEIGTFCFEHRTEINWAKLFTIADSYVIQNEVLCVFSIAHTVLGLPLPIEVSKRMSFRITVVSMAVRMNDIVYFPPISLWYHRRYRSIASVKYRKYFFIKLLVHKGVSPLRLLRIRIILFVAPLLVQCGLQTLKQIMRRERWHI